MTVEVRIIPQGVSGIPKKKSTTSKRKAAKQPNHPAPVKRFTKDAEYLPGGGRYDQAALSTATKMQADNKAEHQRLSNKQIRKLLRENLVIQHPNKSGKEIDALVDQVWPTVMAAYRGAPALKRPERSELESAVWTARNTERRRVVKANRLRRKADQPMSKADREWVNQNFA